MTPELLVALVTAILGAGGLITGVVAWRKDARQGPVDKQTAQVADAVAVSQAATNWVQYQDEKMRSQDEKIQKQDARIAVLVGRVDALTLSQVDLRERVEAWVDWYDDLRNGWSFHKQRDEAPEPPNMLHTRLEEV